MDYIEKERLKYDKQEEQAVMCCDQCKKNIYEDEEFWETDIGNLCENCFDDYQYQERQRCKKVARKDDENGEY